MNNLFSESFSHLYNAQIRSQHPISLKALWSGESVRAAHSAVHEFCVCPRWTQAPNGAAGSHPACVLSM